MNTRRLVALLAGALLLAGLISPANALAPGAVTGRLLAPDGSPQAGALVRLLDLSTGSTAVSTTSSADGAFSFAGSQRPDLFVVQVCQDLVGEEPCLFPGLSLDFVKLYVGPGEREFSLPALTSYFTTDGSSPEVALGDIRLTEPATVEVTVANGLKPTFQRVVTVSSMRRPFKPGPLVFQGLAPGSHLVRAFGQRRVVTVGSGQTADVTISRPQPAVTGRVVLDGRPVGDAPVTLTGADDTSPSGVIRMTRTDARGRYAFRGLPFSGTTWRLRIGAEVSGRGTHALAPGAPHRLVKFRLTGSERRTVDLVTRSARRGALLVRYVREPRGEVVRRAALLTLGGELVGSLPVRHHRSAVEGLVPGRYLVATHWFPSNGLEAADWARVRVRAGATARTTMTPAGGPGRLVVEAPSASYVTSTALFPGGPTSSLRRYAAPTRTLRAGPTGEVVFDGLPVGRYQVYLPGSDGRPDETVTRFVGDGTRTVDLTTPSPEASIRGRLTDPATGRPWPWTRVIADTLDCDAIGDGARDGGSESLGDGGVIVVDDLHTGRYRCQLVGFWEDRGTPWAGPNGFFRPVAGTFDTSSGAQLDRDFPVTFAPAGG